MGVEERINQLLDAQGETVTISQRTQDGTDNFNVPKYVWADEAEEKAIITSRAVPTFAQAYWIQAGQMEAHDRTGYFKASSIIARNKRVVIASGEKYEADTIDTPTIFGVVVHKLVILRRITEQ